MLIIPLHRIKCNVYDLKDAKSVFFALIIGHKYTKLISISKEIAKYCDKNVFSDKIVYCMPFNSLYPLI